MLIDKICLDKILNALMTCRVTRIYKYNFRLKYHVYLSPVKLKCPVLIVQQYLCGSFLIVEDNFKARLF